MSEDGESGSEWNNIRLREDEELDFFTELALHETERWIQLPLLWKVWMALKPGGNLIQEAITRKKFAYPDDFRKSLSNGVLLCELLNELKPGTVKRINKLPGAIAGLDNLNVFLNACEKHFGLTKTELFDPNDLEDLSNRAIADEDEELFKQEVDRRARNVAITVFWLGKSVAGKFSGPILDTSAFSALVHSHGNKQLISDDSFKNESWQQTENLINQEKSNKLQSGYSQHTRDSSYDSLGSYGPESDLSFDDLDGNMPVRSDMRGEMKRAGSTGSLTRDQPLRLPSGSDSVFDRYDSRYGSSPDISHAHTRSSSNDSTEGFNHSRTSSGSTENYPTRRLSSSTRKPSTSADPLQFVKMNKAEDLAKTALQQMEASKVVNKMRPVVEVNADNGDQDWQSNFDSWKSKRRKSTPAFQKIGEAEGLFKDEEPEQQERKVKTFSQIMAEKNKRKSLGNLNSYPFDDDDSGFGGKSEPLISRSTSNKSETQPKKKGSKKEEIAPWARQSSDEGDSHSDSETNNSHQSGDTDSVFSDKSIPKVLSDDDSWVKSKTSSQTNTPNNRFTSPKVDKPISESRKLWENSVQETPKGNEKKKIDIPSRSGDRNIRNIKDAFEQKEKEANATPKVQMRPNRLGSGDRLWKSMDLTNSSPSGYSFCEKPPSPLSPKSPPALVPRDSRFNSPSQQKYGSLPRDITSRQQELSKDKPFTEKTIKINQKPKNSKGFGFTLVGGVEKHQPVTVQRVSLGSEASDLDDVFLEDSSAADVCEVEANDELISINGRDVSNLTLAQVQGIVDHSVKRGQIEIRVKRYIEDGSYDSVEEEETANQNRMDTQSSDASSLSADLTSDETYKPAPKVYTETYQPAPKVYTETYQPTPKVSEGSLEDSYRPRLMDQLINEQEREANNNIAKLNDKLKEDNRPSSPVMVEEQIKANIGYTNQSMPQTEVNIEVKQDETESQRPVLRRDMSYPAEEMIIETRKTISLSKKTPEADQSPNVIRRTMTPSRQFAEVKQVDSPAPPTPPKVEPPALVKSTENLNTSNTSDDSSSSSVGPPAALLRWQRPRTKSEYKNPYQASDEQSRAAKRLSSTLPWRSENTFSLDDYSKDDSMMDRVTKSFEETVSVSKPVESKSTYKFDDDTRLQAWDQKQEQERKPEEPVAIHVNFSREENLTAQSAAPARKVGQVDSPDLMSLNVTVPNDEPPLSPQEKFERDQKRIRMQYEEEKKKNQKLNQEQEKSKIDTDKFLKNMDFQIQTTRQEASANHLNEVPYSRPAQSEPKYTSEPMTFQLSSSTPGRPLMIDPRNQAETSSEMRDDSKPEYVFQVGLPKSESSQPLRNLNDQPAMSSQELLEQERQRIREEEKRKIEEEQKQWKREQERELREQQETLRAEREKLQQEQERISREKAMLEQEKMQPSRSFQSYSSPGSSLGSPVSSISPSPRSPPPALDPKYRDNKAPPPTAPKPNRGEKARLTRDDLLAMNRSAKPLTKRPEGSEQSQSQDSLHNSSTREAPSKVELHSLNAVPKQRVRSSGEWIGNEDRPFVIGKRSDIIHKSNNSNSEDHWLVQEAERRRKQELLERRNNTDSVTARAGPTKPSESSLVSRFRGDMEPPPRNNRYSGTGTYSADLGLSSRPLNSSLRQYNRSPDSTTQFNAKTQPVNYSSPNLSNTLPANFSFNANTSLPSKTSRPIQKESEPVIAVSGKQKCSHCGEELGFGAAMVIETLGLYYHVQCFRCCVCRTTLGNGAEGADVRVRVNKLHCKNCYSNDEAGLKFSKV